MKKTLIYLLVLSQLSFGLTAGATENTQKMTRPRNCDLTVRSHVIDHKDSTPMLTFYGAWDYRGRNWWWDIVIASLTPVGTIIDLTLDYRSCLGVGCNGANAKQWFEKHERSLENKCRRYLKRHFKGEIVTDDGLTLESKQYYCGEPYVERQGKSNVIKVDLYRGTPIFDHEYTFEEIAQLKCRKLAQCVADANSAEELAWISNAQIQMGCQ